MTMNYKSTRLLIEAVNQEMANVRKAAMGNMALGALNELRDLVDQLAKRADRLAVDDVLELAPIDYVAAMKPLVTTYHRQLFFSDLLAPCLCEDLKAVACVVILVGEGKTMVRAAHDQNRPEATLLVETIVASIDDGTKRVATETSEHVSSTSDVWEVYWCDQADPDRACGIRRVGPRDPYERDFIIHDTNREECGHCMSLVDAEHIVALHNGGTKRVADRYGALGVDGASGCPHDRLDHRKCEECGTIECMECHKIVPDFDGITEWYCRRDHG